MIDRPQAAGSCSRAAGRDESTDGGRSRAGWSADQTGQLTGTPPPRPHPTPAAPPMPG